MAQQMTAKDEEHVELATAVDGHTPAIVTVNDDKTEITEKVSQSKWSRNRIIAISIIILIIVVGVIILIWALTTLSQSKSNNEDKETVIDVEDWSYNLILSKNIDDTGLEHGILYKQLNLSMQENGINRINFDANYTYNGPTDYTQTWLNAQSRTVYNYALAYENTKDETFLNYAINGIEGIFAEFYDEIYGGYFRSIIKYNNGTRIIDDTEKDSYQHHFLVKALSKLYQVTMNESYINEAMDIYKNIVWGKFTDETGVGLEQKLTRNFENATEYWKSTDPMLHFYHSSMKLYEAYLMYYESDTNETSSAPMLSFMQEKINKIFDFLMRIRGSITKPDTGDVYDVIFVYYDNDWTPESLGWPLIDNVNIGHAMEFSLFTWQYMDLGVIEATQENIKMANELFEYAIAVAYNESNGALDFLHAAQAPEWQWWQDSQWWIGIESLRTIVYFNTNYNRLKLNELNNMYTKDYVQTILNKVMQWYDDMYYDKKYGGIYPVPQKGAYDKGYEWKVGYHTIEAIFDILNIINSKKLTKI